MESLLGVSLFNRMESIIRVMDDSKLFGQVAIEEGYCSDEQVLEALRLQYKAKVLFGHHLFLGEVLALLGALTPEQIRHCLDLTGTAQEKPGESHNKRLFGEVAVENGFCEPKDVLNCLDVQRREDEAGDRHRIIGEIMFDEGILNREQVETLVEQMIEEPMSASESDSA